MKPFRFRLQKLLRLRTAHEEQQLATFGTQQRLLANERAKLGLFEGEAASQLQEMTVIVARPFRAWSHGANAKYLSRLERVIDFQREQTRLQQLRVSQARDAYLKAKQETRALDKLRDHQWEQWRRDEHAEQQRILDDIRPAEHRGGK